MRTVLMNHCPAAAVAPAGQRARLLRHLLGRMLELEEDGLWVDAPADPFLFRAPLVPVSFTGRDSREMARRLDREYHILVSCPGPSRTPGGPLCLCPAPGVTFEDVDYVQGAIYQLLLEQS